MKNQRNDNPRTFSFQPTDEVRKLVALAEQLKFPHDRSYVINEALQRALPSLIEESADAKMKEITNLVTEFRSDHASMNESFHAHPPVDRTASPKRQTR